MMAEGNLGGAVLGGEAIQGAATQTRPQTTHRLAFWYDALHNAVGVLFDDVERHSERGKILRQHGRGEAGLLLVEIEGEEIKGSRRPPLQRQQNIKQRVGVLSGRQGR